MKHFSLFIALLISGTVALGQSEAVSPLKTNSTLHYKKQRLQERASLRSFPDLYVYELDTIDLPIVDDFSTSLFREYNAQPGDPNVTTQQFKRLMQGATPMHDTTRLMLQDDTTFYLEIDTVTGEIVATPLTPISVTVYDLTQYPITGTPFNLWPRYDIRDTINFPNPVDTTYKNPSIVQDSVDVYFVDAIDPDKIWIDEYAYHNYRYSVNAPTLGVVTFDGVDETGYPYQFTLPTSYGVADYLTSKPIDLNFPASDSIYLSFLYQPQGLGEEPDASDSLVLEFFSPVSLQWENIWSVPGGPLDDFKRVIIVIDQTKYLQDGFRFRFKNYATLSGNLDHWNIDYVELRRFTSKASVELMDDVAFRYPPFSLLNDYTAMPWKHYKWNPVPFTRDTISVFARNNNHLNSRLVVDTMRIFYDAVEQVKIAYPSTSSVNPSTNFKLTFDVLGNGYTMFDTTVNDTSATFELEFSHFTNPDERDENDTTRIKQVFENFYAYDDGTAEAAYGPQAFNSRLAYKFSIAQPDTLRSVQIHFQPSVTDVSNKPFYLTIWDDDGPSGKPGTVIFQNTGQLFPEYTSERNGFYEYHLETWKVVSGTFYVGFQQVDDEKLNVGFDYNLNNQTKIYYSNSAGGSWNQTGFSGSLLMRPVFTSKLDYLLGIPKPLPQHQTFTENIPVKVYPNPTSSLLMVECGLEAPFKAEVMDMSGRTLYIYDEVHQAMDVSSLINGMYLLKLSSAGREVITRFMVNR